jgi:oxygen-independent coproporphyrinogen-3 oxidase
MTEPSPPLGLYVHVPFCTVKCTYCHFAIDPGAPGEDRQDRYTRALEREIGLRRPGASDDAPRADTVYFGGGTPSLLAAERLGRVLEALRRAHAVAESAEVTLEANPRDLDRARYREIAALGVNRLSLGVQSMDDDVLREMGRAHRVADSRKAIEDARGAGFGSVSVDLILGWPWEEAGRWSRGLREILALAPDHVSLYVLEVEGKNLLAHRRRRGTLHLPDDDLVADLYGETVAALGAAGLERYEISNFARPGFESRHNGKYWDDAPFRGFGLSAHGYDGRRRWWNRATYEGYCRSIEAGVDATEGFRDLSAADRASEALFTGLRRRDGIHLAAFRRRYGVDPLVDYADGLRGAWEAGLVETREDRLRLTEKGILLSNEVFAAFV